MSTNGLSLWDTTSASTIGAQIKWGATTVSVSNKQTSGTRLATLTVGGTAHDLYYTNTTYSVATTSAAGLMSATDKTKLNGIDTGATKVTFTSKTETLWNNDPFDAGESKWISMATPSDTNYTWRLIAFDPKDGGFVVKYHNATGAAVWNRTSSTKTMTNPVGYWIGIHN